MKKFIIFFALILLVVLSGCSKDEKYQVKFLNDDGSELKSQLVEEGKSAIPPTNPIKEGYTFKEWDKKFNIITSDLEVRAVYEINKYVVRFIDHDGSILKTEIVLHGANATTPTYPTRTGYTFKEWDKQIINVKSNLDVLATYQINKFTVTFNSNEGSIVNPISVNYNSIVNLVEPTKDGFSFDGWYTGLNVNDPKFNSNTPITSNITLYARWVEKVYTVNFVDWDGTSLYITEVKHNKSAVYLGKELSRVGYTLVGWDTDLVKVTEDTTIRAVYKPILYKLEFVENDGTIVSDLMINYEENLPLLPVPSRMGYDFIGWYNDQDLKVEFTSLTMPLNGAKLYAKWELSKYKVILDTNGGDLLDSLDITYFDELTTLPTPSRVDYIFDGWELDGELIILPYLYTLEMDLTLKARWKALSNGITYVLTDDGEATILDYTGEEKVLVLPNTINGKPITKIAAGVFRDNLFLEEITIGESVIEIGDFAFANIINLKKLTLPKTAITFGETVLNGSNIVDLVISGEAEIRLESLFGNIIPSSLQTVKIADGSLSISNLIIRSNINRVKLILQNNKLVINEREFYLSKYYEIVLPLGLEEIKMGAFEHSRIETISIPSTVKRIEKNVFLYCIKLNDITLPENLEYFEMNFKGCVKLTQVNVPTGNVIIPNDAFYDCVALESVVLPEGITTIGDYAFTNCISLQSIELPLGLISIGKAAFRGCTSLKNITIPQGVIRISEELFYGCSSLSLVNLPDDVVVIEAKAFYECTSLENIKLPNSITVIQKAAFSYCSSLVSIDLPVLIKIIDEEVFSNCASLTSILIPQTVSSIEDFAFYYCKSLNQINISNNLTKIGDFAFYNCINLTSVVLPEEVTSIESFAFANCIKLENITLSLELNSIGEYAFSDSLSLVSITIPSTVEIIEKYAFNKCPNLSIICQMPLIPSGWVSTWNPQNRPVIWD